jgi:hypothetical protein
MLKMLRLIAKTVTWTLPQFEARYRLWVASKPNSSDA